MSRDYCKYHPARPAVWNCGRCRHDLCTECVPGSRENYDGDTPRCVLCDTELTYLGGANLAEPFWRQLHRLFAYPLKVNGLLTLLAMAIAGAALPPNEIRILGLVLLGAFSVHYGLNIIDRVRDGDMNPPGLMEILRDRGEHLFFKQLAVLLLLGLFVGGAMYLDMLLGALALVFVLLAVPAATMLLVMTRSVGDAAHPGNLALVMLRVGPSYLLLWFCLVVVAAGPTLVMPLLAELLPERALYPAFLTVSSYFTFVTYAMMGYILYQKQARLGFTSHEDFGKYLEHRKFVACRSLADARMLAAAGRHGPALDKLRAAIHTDESNAELRELYYRVVSASGDEEAIRRNTNSICEFWMDRKLPEKAAWFCLETRKRFPDFMPDDSTVCHRVAERWFEEGRCKEAVELLAKLHKTAPEYPEMFDALILMARIYFEGLNAGDKAVELLQQLRSMHPGHAGLSRVEHLLKVIGGRPLPAG